MNECVSDVSEPYAERDIIPVLLKQFDADTAEYYSCIYAWMRRENCFEDAAIGFLQQHALSELHTQDVLYALLKSYIPNKLTAPLKWCRIISETDDLCCELYAVAAKYFPMIGEYDLADSIVEKAQALCEDTGAARLLCYSLEGMSAELRKQKDITEKYRTKKPYWPNTEDRRRIVAEFYDARGIKHPRVENKPAKVPESEFVPVHEYEGNDLTNYCTFWCSSVFSAMSSNCIYQIAAVKVRNGLVEDTFTSLVRPWDASVDAKKAAANEAGLPVSDIEAAEDVDLVMTKFFAFVGEDVLVSTDALTSQKKLITRAARYAGMREVKNEFCELLDLAASISEEFELNNSRDYLSFNSKWQRQVLHVWKC